MKNAACLALWLGLASTLLASKSHADIAAAVVLADELLRGQHEGFESFILKQGDNVAARYISAELASRAPDLRSATKSITALLIGIAIDRGELSSVRENVAELLPDYRDVLSQDPFEARMTVEDLLTMRSGRACDDWDASSPGHEDRMYRQRDWLAFWAAQPMAGPPGERFSYCTGNVIALGAVLEAVTGTAVDRYAATHLFEPLGIARAEWARWNRGRGVDTGGHLRLAPEDLLKIGELVLARGEGADRQLVSSAWIEAMTRMHTEIPGTTQMYGYLWWLDRTRSVGLPRTELWWAQGNGGNLLIVLPELDSVIVTTGTRFNRPDALEPMFWLRDRILPGFVVP